MRKTSFLVTALLSLAACDSPPPTPTAIRTQIEADVGYIVAKTNAATAKSPLPSSAALSLLSHALPSLTGSSTTVMSSLVKQSKLAADTGDAIDPQPIIDFLNTKIFTDANALGEGIFTVPASVMCTSLDTTCVSKFTAADVRIRVEQDDDATLAFALQVDADHDEPLSVDLAHDRVGLTVDLDNTNHAVAALAAIFDDAPPNVQLAGQITGAVQILGDLDVSASLSFDRDVSIEIDGFHFATAKSQPDAIVLDLSSVAQEGYLDVAIGQTTATIPSNGDTFALDLPGITAHVASLPNGVSLTGLGLGDHTLSVSKNGQRAIGIDLNPNNSRTLDASVSANGTLTVTPKLDLRMSIDHAVLGDDPGPFDVTQLLLVGSLSPTTTQDQVEVHGAFSIATNPASFGVTAADARCVTFGDSFMLSTCH
jgi:hypothetical protein